MQEEMNLFNEDLSKKNDEKKVEILQLPTTFKHSNYFISNIINLKDTYTTKIFIGLIAGWNKYMYSLDEINDKFYSKENLSLRNKTIEIKTSTFLKQIGVADAKGNYNPILLKKALDHFNKNSTLDVELIKENNPVLYDHIKNIILAESKSKNLNLSFINLFSSIYQSTDEPGLPSYIGFNLTNEAIPIFDAIAKNYTLVTLESIAVLSKPSVKLYDFLKAILGNRTEYQYTIWLDPSDTNSNIYNLRTILDYLEITKQGRYKYRGNDLISKTLECFKEINENCKDLYIEFNFDKKSEDYEKQFVKKGVKYQGIKLKLYSYNPNDPIPRFDIIKKYNDCKFVQDEYLNDDLIKFTTINEDFQKLTCNVLNVLESEKFRDMYWDPKVMHEDTFLQLKKDYLDLCYYYALSQYNSEYNELKINKKGIEAWKYFITRIMMFYLLNGKNIYDGQIFKNNSYGTWTPNDKVDKYKLKHLIKNPEYIDENIQRTKELDDFIKRFMNEIN